ncbi:MAG TPA: hypothetical protein VGZ91_08630 [Candidatus Sulfotelmatobacter sp.]|jgi:hypothetical protein|nr:hypothetical protein [Candidatus Sulfotelmatobacter sp.]
MNSPQNESFWKKDLNAYACCELQAITFQTDNDLQNAIRRIWNMDELRNLPREPASDRTIVIPATAVQYFSGLQFKTHSVISSAELTAAERRKFIQGQGHH